jgi:predicted nucleic acid-binding Zn ribbon protein
MPIYVYQGLESGQLFEFEQRFQDPPFERHPETGEPLKRLIHPPAIIFKGSGWYSTDHRSTKSSGDSAAKESSGQQ